MKGYTVSTFTGSEISEVRFLSGAFKQDSFFSGAAEYRDAYYKASPSNPLLAELAAVDIAIDKFYTKPPAVNINLSKFSCSAKADIVVSMDMGNAAIKPIVDKCEGDQLQNMDFCRQDSDVNQADMNWFNVCQGP